MVARWIHPITIAELYDLHKNTCEHDDDDEGPVSEGCFPGRMSPVEMPENQARGAAQPLHDLSLRSQRYMARQRWNCG